MLAQHYLGVFLNTWYQLHFVFCFGFFQGTNEILRLYIALTGMQYAGKILTDKIKYVLIYC